MSYHYPKNSSHEDEVGHLVQDGLEVETNATRTAFPESHYSPPHGDGQKPLSSSPETSGSRRFSFPAVPRLSKYGLGIFLILCVTVIWVASSEWIQFIFGLLHFDKPFFLTYFNTSGFALWNLGYWLKPSWRDVPWEDEEVPQPIHIEDPAFTYLLLKDVKQRIKQKLLGAGEGDADAVQVVDNGEAIEKAFQSRLRTDAKFREWCIAHDNCFDYGASSPTSEQAGAEMPPTSRMRVGPAAETAIVDGCILDEHEDTDDSEYDGEQRGLGSDVTRISALIGPHQTRRHKAKSDAAVPSSADLADDVVVVLEQTNPQTNDDEQDALTRNPVCVRVHSVRPYSMKRIWKAAALFCPFWFLANYLFNLSLSYTSVSSNTIMSAMGTVWTVIISRVFLSVPIGPYKLAGVAICISGSMIVSLSSSSDNGSSLLGNTIALLSSFFYAVYTFVLRWCLPDDDRYSMGQVFGAVGVINMAVLWVGFPLLHYIGLEPFSFPTLEQFLPLLVNALIGTNLSDVLWARSVILTSPVVATLGLSLTTPLSMVVDAILHGSYYPIAYIIGAMCVLAGFVVANIR